MPKTEKISELKPPDLNHITSYFESIEDLKYKLQQSLNSYPCSNHDIMAALLLLCEEIQEIKAILEFNKIM